MLYILIATGLLIVLVVLAIALKRIKDFLKVIVLVFIIFSIITLALSVIIIMDAKEFQSRINDASKKFILVEDDRVIAGVGIHKSDVMFYEQEDIVRFQKNFDEGSFEKIRQNDYKIFFFDMLAFEKILQTPLALPGLNISLEKDELVTFMNTENGVDIISRKIYNTLSQEARLHISFDEFHVEIVDRLGPVDVFKAQILGLLIDKSMSNDYIGFLKDGLRKKTIRVYPQTIMFLTIKYAPESIVESIAR